jgi:predicted nucleic acid-binding protein
VPVVISDTSPLRALAHLALLDLLRQVYGQVLVPPAVEGELLAGLPAVDVTQLPFVKVQAPQDRSKVQAFLRQLQAGESEALALALELTDPLILLDEAKARKFAQQLGVAMTGTLGILLQAKSTGLVPAIRPLIDSLQNDLGFFISAQLRAAVLQQAGE